MLVANLSFIEKIDLLIAKKYMKCITKEDESLLKVMIKIYGLVEEINFGINLPRNLNIKDFIIRIENQALNDMFYRIKNVAKK
jgi:hypothetical protein